MKPLLTLLSLMLTFTGNAQRENWSVYLADYDGKPGSTLVDLDLKNKAPDPQYPFCVRAGATLRNCDKHGFPEDSASFALAEQLLAATDSLLKSTKKYIPAGTFMMDCSRENYYYVTDTVGLRLALESLYKKGFPDDKYILAMKDDHSWKTYLEFLYPNEQSLEWIMNGKLAARFIAAGDDLLASRSVDHFLLFKTQEDCDQFIKDYAQPLEFTVIASRKENDSAYPYKLHLGKTDFIETNHMTNVTLSLRTEAAKYNGRYDGWESVLVKDK